MRFPFIGRNNNQSPDTVINRVSDHGYGLIPAGSGVAPVLNHESSLEISAILCATRKIADDLASLPLDLIEELDTKSDTPKTRKRKDHWAYKLLRKPNNYQSRAMFLHMMACNAILGRGALAIKTIVRNEVRELRPVPFGAWTQEQLGDGSYQFRVNMANGSQQVFSASECLFIHGMSLDGYTAISVLEKARRAAGIASGLEGLSLKAVNNGGRPSGIIAFDNELKPEKKKQLDETYKDKFGAGGSGGIAILDNGAKFHPMEQTAVDAQINDARNFQVNEVARLFGIHPAFLMDGTVITHELTRAYVLHTLRPWLDKFEDALMKDVLNYEEGLSFSFDERELLRGDHVAMGSFLTQMLGSGGTPAVMSVDECRVELGLSPTHDPDHAVPSKGGYAIAGGAVAAADPATKAQLLELLVKALAP